ncbi:MAG: acyl transferase [Chitinophagaceae bacterium]|nr:acyl transferase [Chitinophagaceae bacterium]
MNYLSENQGPVNPFRDFNISTFEEKCAETFYFQYKNNLVYRQFADLLGFEPRVDGPVQHDTVHDPDNPPLTGSAISVLPSNSMSLYRIPFLPIRFFKTHRITTGDFREQAIFESSGTTQTGQSRHYVKDAGLYEQSFIEAFRIFYGDIREYCILALLPSYLERGHSSLVYMAETLIRLSGHPHSGFYLDQFSTLHSVLRELESRGQKTILLGVTFALLDFAETTRMELKHTMVMETGGMKGRKRELTREEVHGFLMGRWGLKQVHAEYGMTELLSQAYSKGGGRFHCPPWMRVLLRSEDDPLSLTDEAGNPRTEGLINIIDLANIHSCAFIATDDLGRLHPDGSFEVIGRMDNSDLRGCSLLTA